MGEKQIWQNIIVDADSDEQFYVPKCGLLLLYL